MNCTKFQKQLSEYITGELPERDAKVISQHIEKCAGCRREHHTLQRVLGALDETPPAERVNVDYSKLYQQAAFENQRQLRRWRRIGIGVTAAAAVLLVFVGLKLHVQIDRHQFVLRWSEPPVDRQSQPQQQVNPPVVNDQPEVSKLAVTAEDFELMKQLVHALAADIDRVDDKYQEQLIDLSSKYSSLESLTKERWTAAQRQFYVLYTAQFGDVRKGAKP